MKVVVKRIAKKANYTIGKVYVDGKWICDSIEDKDRGLTDSMTLEQIKKIKVKSQTAIPSGTYTLTLNTYSPKFGQKAYYKAYCKGKVPRVLNVKGFDGILLHRGVDQNSSSGCIILGYNTIVGKVTNSQKAFETLYSIMKAASDKGEHITITIE